MRSGPNSQKLHRDSIIDFFQNEGRVRYDEIVRNDLPVKEKFDEDAYKKFIRLAWISEVLDRNAILKNLKCASDVNSELCFTNAGALFFRKNDEDVEFRHAGLVCALYKGVRGGLKEGQNQRFITRPVLRKTHQSPHAPQNEIDFD